MNDVAILAIDPGPKESGYAMFNPNGTLQHFGIKPNEEVEDMCRGHVEVVVEWIESYGMPVGKDVFNTVLWIGRFWGTADGYALSWTKIPRREVKLHICNSPRAKDANIRRAVLDRFPATGGGKVPQIGTKAKPGPLYGAKSHVWAALALGLTYMDKSFKNLPF